MKEVCERLFTCKIFLIIKSANDKVIRELIKQLSKKLILSYLTHLKFSLDVQYIHINMFTVHRGCHLVESVLFQR